MQRCAGIQIFYEIQAEFKWKDSLFVRNLNEIILMLNGINVLFVQNIMVTFSVRPKRIINMKSDGNFVHRTERNIIDAASNGATQSVKLVANIAVNLIAFVALLDFVNATLTWFGDRVGMHDPKLTFQVFLTCQPLFLFLFFSFFSLSSFLSFIVFCSFCLPLFLSFCLPSFLPLFCIFVRFFSLFDIDALFCCPVSL